MLKSLKLTNFRQFDSLCLTFEKPWTLIIGPNAKGKSTILESLHMLSHGESPWESNHNYIIKLHTEKENPSDFEKLVQSTSRIEATVSDGNEEKSLALSFTTRNNATTKQYLVNGNSTTRNRFLAHFYSVLFSPDLIDLLMFEPSQRRDFLDFHASYLFPELRDISLNYRKILRHRNSILKSIAAQRYRRYSDQFNGLEDLDFEPCSREEREDRQQNGNGNMLTYWTSQLIDLGSQIIDFRLALIELLNRKNPLYPTLLSYLPTVPVEHKETRPPLASVRSAFSNRIASLEEKEKLAGKTLVGPHRDDWHLAVASLDVNRYGSRGEKRLAIADIIFKLNDILKKSFHLTPILLLDDISSELDDKNIRTLYQKKLSPEQQTIITATSLSGFPKKVISSAHIITL